MEFNNRELGMLRIKLSTLERQLAAHRKALTDVKCERDEAQTKLAKAMELLTPYARMLVEEVKP